MNIFLRHACLRRPSVHSYSRDLTILGGSKRHQRFEHTATFFGIFAALCITPTMQSRWIMGDNEKNTNKKKRIISKDELGKHNSLGNGVWVSFEGKAYDVTNFVRDHPGGQDKILLAAGGPLEPLWRMYPLHTTTSKEDVESILQKYYIGDLDPSEAEKDDTSDENNPWKDEPERHPALRAHGKFPFNAETPISLIPEHFETPNELYYVRHHHPVPVVDMATYELKIHLPNSTKVLTLEDVKNKFKKRDVTMTMQCGGNRRGELSSGGKTKGIQWGAGAISTATWSGARLSDVLKSFGLSYKIAEEEGVKHIQFIPLDPPYDASVPFHRGFEERNDVLLAYEMNGGPIPREHGYPLRAIIPGTIGARSVKWLESICLRSDEAESGWQRNVQYKSFSPEVKSFEGIDPSNAMSVQAMPVQSAICLPTNRSIIEIDEDDAIIDVSGYSWSGGGQKIIRVEVSSDDGKTWHEATLESGSEQEIGRAWAWTLWTTSVPIAAENLKSKTVNLMCRAVDSNCNQQPESVNTVWNLRGILNNSYNTISVSLDM
jgi:sulfite oxidase